MTKNKKGLIIFIIGIAFLIYAPLGNIVALPGYLRFVARGGKSAAGNTMDMSVVIGATKTILWMMAYQIGVIMVVLGAILRSGLERLKIAVIILAGIAYIGFSSIPKLPGAFGGFYGIGGCLILLFFILSVFFYGKGRESVSEEARTAYDIRMIGYVFFGFAAWHVCGLGSVGHILNPEWMIQHNSEIMVSTLMIKIMIEFIIAGAFTFTSYYLEYNLKKEIVGEIEG